MADPSLFLVIPDVNGRRVYRVRSKSEPGKRHTVDLHKASCTCVYAQINRLSDRLCEHQQLAVAFEQEQRELQADMPLVTARLKSEITGRRVLPEVVGMTEDELKAVFA